jgi:hypothetical protein
MKAILKSGRKHSAGCRGGIRRVYIRPLTHRNLRGEVYERTAEVQEHIRAALALEPESILQRARIRSYKAPGYLREECLVYLIREYLGRGARRVAKRLSEILHGRCARYVNERLRALGSQHVDDAFNDVMKGMYERIYELENDRGDFFQVRFWVALRGLVANTFDRYVKRIERDKTKEQNLARIGAIPGTEGAEDERPDPVDAVEDPTAAVEDLTESKEGLNAIKDHRHRVAFTLRYFGRMKIESKDVEEPTISKHFDRTPRAIRGWIEQAERDLKEWRGEAT